MAAMLFELLGLPLLRSHRSHPLVGLRHRGDEPQRPGVTAAAQTRQEMTMHVIEAEGLRKIYPGGVEAVKGIDFQVNEGEVFGLLGPNGAGKSTTVGMLTT